MRSAPRPARRRRAPGTIMSRASWPAKSNTLCSSSSWARGITPAPSASSTSARSSSALRIESPAVTSVTPNGRRNRPAERWNTHTSGLRPSAISSIGRATRTTSRSARSSVSAFGTSSPSTTDRYVTTDEGDHERRPARDRVAEQPAHERLGERAHEDPDRGDADLHGRDHAHGVVHQPQRGLRAGGSGLGTGRQRGAARGDDGVLADHEEGVRGDEAENGEDAEEVTHPRER